MTAELKKYPGYELNISQAGLASSVRVSAVDERGEPREIDLVGERPLTVYLNRAEIVTLMTIGSEPELLTLGYLKNQGILEDLASVRVVQVDWETDAVSVITDVPESGLEQKLSHRTVTTGCGQGTVFGRLVDKLQSIRIPEMRIRQSHLYRLMSALREHNEVYKRAGAVHGCALCHAEEIEFFVEDVGRHNAVDAIAGHMWLNRLQGTNRLFYTTGRLTSEMVIKVTQMGIPVLLSRSGATQMGVEMARQAGVTLISRARGRHFLVLNGAENIEFDQTG